MQSQWGASVRSYFAQEFTNNSDTQLVYYIEVRWQEVWSLIVVKEKVQCRNYLPGGES